jgi:hypothetical protein
MQGKTIYRVGQSSRTGRWVMRETTTPSGERVISVNPETHRRALDAAANASRTTTAPPKPKDGA